MMNRRWIIGLTSGSSLQGVDAALTEWTGVGMNARPRLLHFHRQPFAGDLRDLAARLADNQPCAIRDAANLTNDRRLDVPSTVMCSSMTSGEIKAAVEAGYPWIAGLADLRNVTYVDLPTGHWPMWSRPKDVAAVLADVAQRAAPS